MSRKKPLTDEEFHAKGLECLQININIAAEDAHHYKLTKEQLLERIGAAYDNEAARRAEKRRAQMRFWGQES